MRLFKILSVIEMLIYFSVLLFAVTREKKIKNREDFFLADRKLPFWMLSITFIASWWGAGSAIETADLAFERGLGAFWFYGMPVLIANLFIIIESKGIRHVGYFTQGEMMAARYSKATSKMLAALILIFMTFSAASQMVAVGHFFGTYLGWNYEVALLIGTGIVIFYSMFGGFRGVVLTDIIQFVLLAVAAVAVFTVAYTKSGGLSKIALVAAERGKSKGYMSMTADASQYLPYVITFGASWMIQANVWQRISASRSDDDARKMTVVSLFAYIPLYLIVVLTGMAGLVLFDELPQGGVVSAIVLKEMPQVLSALVFVGISAAIMSTMDSLINTGAMSLVIDLDPRSLDEKQQLKNSRLATLLVAAAGMLISLKIRSILDISVIASDVITTGVFVPLILGFLWRRGNSAGAMVSMIFGMGYSLYHSLATFFNVSLPLPSFMSNGTTYIVMGISVSALLYISVSLMTSPQYEKADRFISEAGFRKS